MAAPDSEARPIRLPVEEADLPVLDTATTEGICSEHKRSILQFAERMLSFNWTPEQIVFVAAVWPWETLARAVAWERQKRAQPLVSPPPVGKPKADPKS